MTLPKSCSKCVRQDYPCLGRNQYSFYMEHMHTYMLGGRFWNEDVTHLPKIGEDLAGKKNSFHHVFVLSIATSFNLVFSGWKTLSLLCLKTVVAILWIQVAFRVLFVNIKFPVSFPLWCPSSVQQGAQCLRWPALTPTRADQSLSILRRN